MPLGATSCKSFGVFGVLAGDFGVPLGVVDAAFGVAVFGVVGLGEYAWNTS